MKTNRFSLAVVLGALAVSAGGCVSHGMVLDFNGRMIEVEQVKDVRLPRGLEVTGFDGRVMKVNGREGISLNGKELTVNGSNVSHGNSRHVLSPQHKLVIEQSGTLSIADKNSSKSWWAFWR